MLIGQRLALVCLYRYLRGYKIMGLHRQFTDTELASLLSTGDEIAFKLIYQKYWDKLIAVAGKRLGDARVPSSSSRALISILPWRSNLRLSTGWPSAPALASSGH